MRVPDVIAGLVLLSVALGCNSIAFGPRLSTLDATALARAFVEWTKGTAPFPGHNDPNEYKNMDACLRGENSFTGGNEALIELCEPDTGESACYYWLYRLRDDRLQPVSSLQYQELPRQIYDSLDSIATRPMRIHVKHLANGDLDVKYGYCWSSAEAIVRVESAQVSLVEFKIGRIAN